MRKAVVAVLAATAIGMAGGSVVPGQAVPAGPAFRHTVAPKVVKQRVQRASLRYARQYVALRKRSTRAAAARELSLTLSVRGPRSGAHTYVATLTTRGARAVIGLRPGYSVGRNGRAVPDRGPTACATISLKALDQGRKRTTAVTVRLGTVATPRARCIRR